METRNKLTATREGSSQGTDANDPWTWTWTTGQGLTGGGVSEGGQGRATGVGNWDNCNRKQKLIKIKIKIIQTLCNRHTNRQIYQTKQSPKVDTEK